MILVPVTILVPVPILVPVLVPVPVPVNPKTFLVFSVSRRASWGDVAFEPIPLSPQ